MHSIFATKIRRDHGPMKGRKVQRIEQSDLQCGQVAVAKERLGMVAQDIHIKMFEQVVCAVAATRGKDEPNRIVRKSCMQVEQSLLRRSRKIERSAGEHVWRFHWQEAQVA